MTDTYTPPKKWTNDQENGGQWASINRPDSGARFERDLPQGKHPFQLYSMGTPMVKKSPLCLKNYSPLAFKPLNMMRT